jgi:hypothetical protein
LDDNNYKATDLWAVQTSTFIKKFFGETSSEHEYIRNLKVRDEWEKMREWEKKDKDSARLFLRQCIQTIERIGLYEPPQSNIFTSLSNEVLVPAVLAVIGGVFYFGFYVGNINSNNDRYELKEEIRTVKDSLKLYRQKVEILNTQPKSSETKKDTDKAARY